MDNLISIVIPTFNRSKTILTAVDSVAAQSADNWELIIVDDGSVDNTKEKLQNFLNNDRIQYHYQKNAGVSAARNKGAELSRGSHLIFLDSDDRFLPGLFAELNKINFQKFNLICWQVQKRIDNQNSVWKPTRLKGIYNNVTASFLAGSVCYSKKLFFEVGGFDQEMHFGENYELGLRICQKENLRIKILNHQYLFYAIQQSSRESNSLLNRFSSYKHLFDKHHDKYIKHRKSYSELNYLLGYVSEKLGRNSEAEIYYLSSYRANPLNYKAFLRLMFSKVFKR